MDTSSCASEVRLVIDCRETALVKELLSIGCAHQTKQLPVGDIIFQKVFNCECGDAHERSYSLFILERKTVSDFYSSILSGRYAEQRNRLKATGVKVAYVVEGYTQTKLSPLVSSAFVKKDSLIVAVNGAIENLVLHHNIFVLPTFSIDGTAKMLSSILKKITEKGITEMPRNSVSPNGPSGEVAKRGAKVMEEIFLHQLMLIQGVSESVAKLITAKYPKVKDLIEAYNKLDDADKRKSMLAGIMVGKKRLGKIVSARIYEVYC